MNFLPFLNNSRNMVEKISLKLLSAFLDHMAFAELGND